MLQMLYRTLNFITPGMDKRNSPGMNGFMPGLLILFYQNNNYCSDKTILLSVFTVNYSTRGILTVSVHP